ncbi:hypothetical protein ACFCYM_18580 [Streptomyces sp. NPDC056254]|uniref:hypothetical protein n=1 Tax=Streptomyces sp. NPDC056254 TaxID=3345763 RepID=UPI0035E01914
MVGNDGEEPLELTVEPWADIHHIPPKDTCTVTTHRPAGDDTRSSTPHGDEPFPVQHRPHAVTIWAHDHGFHPTDRNGNPTHANTYSGGCPTHNPAT